MDEFSITKLTERQVKIGDAVTFISDVVMWCVIFATIGLVTFVFLWKG